MKAPLGSEIIKTRLAEDMLRRVRNTNNRAKARYDSDEEGEARRDNFIDDSEGNDDVEDFMFPDNVRIEVPRTTRVSIMEQIKAKRKKAEARIRR